MRACMRGERERERVGSFPRPSECSIVSRYVLKSVQLTLRNRTLSSANFLGKLAMDERVDEIKLAHH